MRSTALGRSWRARTPSRGRRPTELREIVGGLEPATLAERGLAAALRELCERTLGRRGTRFDLELDAAPALGPGATSGIYQVAREALDQAVRRGPPAHVRVALSERAGAASSSSSPTTLRPSGARRSIDGLAERAGELNARLTAGAGGERTVVRLTLPPSATAL